MEEAGLWFCATQGSAGKLFRFATKQEFDCVGVVLPGTPLVPSQTAVLNLMSGEVSVEPLRELLRRGGVAAIGHRRLLRVGDAKLDRTREDNLRLLFQDLSAPEAASSLPSAEVPPQTTVSLLLGEPTDATARLGRFVDELGIPRIPGKISIRVLEELNEELRPGPHLEAENAVLAALFKAWFCGGEIAELLTTLTSGQSPNFGPLRRRETEPRPRGGAGLSLGGSSSPPRRALSPPETREQPLSPRRATQPETPPPPTPPTPPISPSGPSPPPAQSAGECLTSVSSPPLPTPGNRPLRAMALPGTAVPPRPGLGAGPSPTVLLACELLSRASLDPQVAARLAAAKPLEPQRSARVAGRLADWLSATMRSLDLPEIPVLDLTPLFSLADLQLPRIASRSCVVTTRPTARLYLEGTILVDREGFGLNFLSASELEQLEAELSRRPAPEEQRLRTLVARALAS